MFEDQDHSRVYPEGPSDLHPAAQVVGRAHAAGKEDRVDDWLGVPSGRNMVTIHPPYGFPRENLGPVINDLRTEFPCSGLQTIMEAGVTMIVVYLRGEDR